MTPRFSQQPRHSFARHLARSTRGGLAAGLILALAGAASAQPRAVAGRTAADAATPASTGTARDSKVKGPAAAGSGPLAQLKQANANLKKVLQKQRPSWSPESDLRTNEVKKVLSDFLDYEELARRSLPKHWDKLAPRQRSEFVATLRELVERSYVRQVYGQPDYDLKLENEVKSEGQATVTGALSAVHRGKKVKMALEYKLVEKDGRWLVYDVITDELSLLENYRAEFNKVVAKDGFDALLVRMKKKLSDKGEKTASKAGDQSPDRPGAGAVTKEASGTTPVSKKPR